MYILKQEMFARIVFFPYIINLNECGFYFANMKHPCDSSTYIRALQEFICTNFSDQQRENLKKLSQTFQAIQ